MVLLLPVVVCASRFSKAEYTKPKYILKIGNKSQLEYSLDSISQNTFDKITVIGL